MEPYAMAYQAIVTKYLGPTNTQGSRIKATADAGSVTIPYDYSMNSDRAHAKAAQALAEKLGWEGRWFEGGAPGGSGNVYVCVNLSWGENITKAVMENAAFATAAKPSGEEA